MDGTTARARRKLAPKLAARESAGASVSERIYVELKAAIVAPAVPLWTDEAGDGRFVWRATTR